MVSPVGRKPNLKSVFKNLDHHGNNMDHGIVNIVDTVFLKYILSLHSLLYIMNSLYKTFYTNINHVYYSLIFLQ